MDPTHLGNVRDQSSNVVWLDETQNSDNYRKHYRAFVKDGTEITVNSFVLVLPKVGPHYIGYIEDLYENENGSKGAKLRWLHRHIEMRDLFADLDKKSKEVYISRTIRSINIETIDSIATVLTPDHYSRCLDLFKDTPLSNFGIYMCCKEFTGNAIKHFDISRLPGYSNQGIVSLLHSHEESTNRITDLPCGNPSMQFPRRARSQRNKKQKIVPSGDSNSISEEQIGNSDASCSNKQIGNSDASCSNKQIGNSDASCSNSGNEIIENEHVPAKMQLKRLVHSIRRELDGSGRVEILSCAHEDYEVLSPRFPGRWLKCQILGTSDTRIVVKYLDGEAGGRQEQVTLPSGVAPPDRLGMRLAGRKTYRPSPPQDSSNSSFQLGESVDVWLHESWCEGVFISTGDISTPDQFLVYLPGENILETFHISEIRVSKDWVDDEWKEIPRKLDILSVMTSMLAAVSANPPA